MTVPDTRRTGGTVLHDVVAMCTRERRAGCNHVQGVAYATRADLALLVTLLDHGGDAALPDRSGCTPLHMACLSSSPDAAKAVSYMRHLFSYTASQNRPTALPLKPTSLLTEGDAIAEPRGRRARSLARLYRSSICRGDAAVPRRGRRRRCHRGCTACAWGWYLFLFCSS